MLRLVLLLLATDFAASDDSLDSSDSQLIKRSQFRTTVIVLTTQYAPSTSALCAERI
ncbi:serine protease inhibitor Kazal-type 2 isoform X1 [Rattus norvegicus]|uniref:serine protease inhibitor Kazal-type 2 isoform X1 n=1 Tax=Rattus norvegicus TaxID=10116 RepID=UPI0008101861|nr:serine protease inhibitor Kazal-type 2 isoform X1 [Rattus norvegicus]|eukprot:XP_017454815.1 PREDICTED: serine protease inhibitor Kazal-type 2 isoform X1 [Rattus norvegicus]